MLLIVTHLLLSTPFYHVAASTFTVLELPSRKPFTAFRDSELLHLSITFILCPSGPMLTK